MTRMFFCFIVLLVAGSVNATTYYLDADDGSNADDGLSPATAWKDLFKIRASLPAPGDVYLFKRGCAWSEFQFYVTASGVSGNPIRYGAYGSPQDPLPIISTLAEVPGSMIASNWAQTSATTWTLPLALEERPGRLFADGTELLRADALLDLGQADNEGAIGVWFYDTLSNELHLDANQNPTLTYGTISGSRALYSSLVENAEYIEFSDINFQAGSGASLALLGGQHITIKNCELGRNGRTGLLLLNTTTRTSSEVIIQDNIFDSGFTFYYGYGSDRGCGDGIRLRDGAINCEIRANVFRNWAHNAIELLGTSTSATGVNNNRIYDNAISAPDIPYAHPIGVDGYYGKCQNNEIFQNWAKDCRTAAQLNGNDNWYHHNIFQGMRKSPSKEQATAHGIIISVYDVGLVCEDNRYDHNLIIDTDEAGFLVRGYGFSNKVQGNILRNNIAYDTGKAPYENDYEEGTAIVIYDTNDDGLGPNTYQNNLFYSPNALAVPIYLQDDNTYHTAAQFNQRDGVEGNTVEDNLDLEPRFANLASNNFSPADDSPLINAGLDTGLAEDFAGNSRLVGVAPDIGPYESSLLVALPVSWLDLKLECTEQQSILSWRVQEQNNAYFTIERSTDAERWQEMGVVESEAHTVAIQAYEFIDKEPAVGLVYYRIQQTDWDGRFSYSDFISCRGEIGQETIRLIPQGAKQFRIAVDAAAQSVNWQLLLYSSTGQRLANYQAVSILDLSAFPAGAYYLQVRLADTQQTIPFVLH